MEDKDEIVQMQLEELHNRIDACRRCEGEVSPYRKPSSLARGSGRKIVIVGQGPGNSELTSGQAFSGQAGTRLNEWLVKSGQPEDDPRIGIYLTSLVKCATEGETSFRTLQKNCRPFLTQQLETLQPELIITLGADAYEQLGFTGLQYADALCGMYRVSDYLLFGLYGFDFRHLVWPHPSGLNRWHNLATNRERLEESFDLLGKMIGEII